MLQLKQLRTEAGGFRLRDIDLEVDSGSYGALLGPPGSGKSVLVETICGLRPATGGRVVIDGVDVTDLDPRERRIGYVPQAYVLFPTKRVSDNITFGLRARGLSQAQALEQAGPIIDLLGIGELLNRWPTTLSGGEQQRVALARALAIKPRLLLLDEPVSALDEGLRERVCRDLRRFQHELNITTVHISHNLEEALAVSDWAAVLDDGRLLQVAPMGDLLRRPENETVARFLRAENILTGMAQELSDGESHLEFAGHHIRVPGRCKGPVTFMIRPEAVGIAAAGSDADNAVTGTLVDIADRGVYLRLEIDLGLPLVAYLVPQVGHHPELTVGQDYAVIFPKNRLHVFRPQTPAAEPLPVPDPA